MADLNSFPIPSSTIFGGMRKFLFILTGNVIAMPDIVNCECLNTISVILHQGLREGFFLKDTGIFEETYKTDAGGPIYKQSFTGFYPDHNKIILDLFSKMQQHRYVLFPIDTNKLVRMMGDKNAGAKFTWKYSSGNKFSSEPGYDYKFECESPDPAPVYPFITIDC